LDYTFTKRVISIGHRAGVALHYTNRLARFPELRKAKIDSRALSAPRARGDLVQAIARRGRAFKPRIDLWLSSSVREQLNRLLMEKKSSEVRAGRVMHRQPLGPQQYSLLWRGRPV